AETIAAEAGADVVPGRFRPVLRGVLLTGGEPTYLRRELTGAPERPPLAVADPLWWPPVKIVGRYLAPFLASIAELETPPELPPVAPSGLDIEIELEPETLQKLPGARLRFEADDGE